MERGFGPGFDPRRLHHTPGAAPGSGCVFDPWAAYRLTARELRSGFAPHLERKAPGGSRRAGFSSSFRVRRALRSELVLAAFAAMPTSAGTEHLVAVPKDQLACPALAPVVVNR